MKICCKNIYQLLFCYILFNYTAFAENKPNIQEDTEQYKIKSSSHQQQQQQKQSTKKLSKPTTDFWNTLKCFLQSKDIKSFKKEITNYIKNVNISNNNDHEKLLNFLNFQDQNGNSLLHFAVQIGDLECVKILLENKIDVNLQNKEGKTAIIIAVENDNCEIMLRLLGNGADLEKKSKQYNDIFTEAWAHHNSNCANIIWKVKERLQR
jgi:hypothetical protein